eukprot:scaffold45218_cov61-Phaeocystis_antarctica.AAC.6
MHLRPTGILCRRLQRLEKPGAVRRAIHVASTRVGPIVVLEALSRRGQVLYVAEKIGWESGVLRAGL